MIRVPSFWPRFCCSFFLLVRSLKRDGLLPRWHSPPMFLSRHNSFMWLVEIAIDTRLSGARAQASRGKVPLLSSRSGAPYPIISLSLRLLGGGGQRACVVLAIVWQPCQGRDHFFLILAGTGNKYNERCCRGRSGSSEKVLTRYRVMALFGGSSKVIVAKRCEKARVRHSRRFWRRTFFFFFFAIMPQP